MSFEVVLCEVRVSVSCVWLTAAAPDPGVRFNAAPDPVVSGKSAPYGVLHSTVNGGSHADARARPIPLWGKPNGEVCCGNIRLSDRYIQYKAENLRK